VVNFALWPLYPKEKPPVPIEWELEWPKCLYGRLGFLWYRTTIEETLDFKPEIKVKF